MSEQIKYTSTAKKFLRIKNLQNISALLRMKPKYLLHIAHSPVYKSFKIPKSSGGYRQIDSPERIHMNIQKRLNRYLQEVYTSLRPDQVNGFIKRAGKDGPIINIRSNASPHIGKEYVINVDLKDFFHSITAGRVRDMFTAAPFNYKRDLASLLAVLTTWYNKLPMGAPTSPVISNLVLMDLDSALIGLAEKHSYTYSRYADDISFSGDAEPGDSFLAALSRMIEAEGFAINAKKFRVQRRFSRQVVTGIVVNEKYNLPRRYYRNLRAVLHDWEVNGISVAAVKYFRLERPPDRRVLNKFINSVQAKIEYLEYVRGLCDPLPAKLREKFRANLYGTL